jgi:hypothetical protein
MTTKLIRIERTSDGVVVGSYHVPGPTVDDAVMTEMTSYLETKKYRVVVAEPDLEAGPLVMGDVRAVFKAFNQQLETALKVDQKLLEKTVKETIEKIVPKPITVTEQIVPTDTLSVEVQEVPSSPPPPAQVSRRKKDA